MQNACRLSMVRTNAGAIVALRGMARYVLISMNARPMSRYVAVTLGASTQMVHLPAPARKDSLEAS